MDYWYHDKLGEIFECKIGKNFLSCSIKHPYLTSINVSINSEDISFMFVLSKRILQWQRKIQVFYLFQ